MNCKATSAASIPPAAISEKPGRALPIADTARNAIGRMALPETPPYVVLCSLPMFGQATPLVFTPIRPETVLVAVTPVAPPEQTEMSTEQSDSMARWACTVEPL